MSKIIFSLHETKYCIVASIVQSNINHQWVNISYDTKASILFKYRLQTLWMHCIMHKIAQYIDYKTAITSTINMRYLETVKQLLLQIAWWKKYRIPLPNIILSNLSI